MTSSRIDAFLTARGVQPTCELCGHNNWSLPSDDAPMVVKLNTQTPAPRGPPNALLGLAAPMLPTPGTINAYMVACLNCGNIRLHAEAVVKGPAGL